jgi:hypothetical protein
VIIKKFALCTRRMLYLKALFVAANYETVVEF